MSQCYESSVPAQGVCEWKLVPAARARLVVGVLACAGSCWSQWGLSTWREWGSSAPSPWGRSSVRIPKPPGRKEWGEWRLHTSSWSGAASHGERACCQLLGFLLKTRCVRGVRIPSLANPWLTTFTASELSQPEPQRLIERFRGVSVSSFIQETPR